MNTQNPCDKCTPLHAAFEDVNKTVDCECPCHTTQNKHYWFLQAGEIIECGHCHPVKWAINQDRQCDCKCHTQNNWEPKTSEDIAMNIVYQLGDALYDALPKDIAHKYFVDARQATNDKLIDFTQKMVESFAASQRETLAVSLELGGEFVDLEGDFRPGARLKLIQSLTDAAAHIRKV